MRKVLVDSLEPGMKVARPVFNTDGRILINTGVIIRPNYIRLLKHLGVLIVFVDDEQFPAVEVEDILSQETRMRATKVVRDLIINARRQEGSGRAIIINTNEVGSVINEIIGNLFQRDLLMLNLADVRSVDDYTFSHSLNVCLMGLIAGISLNLGKRRLFELGMGAMLHDMGKTKIPDKILKKPGPLTKEEMIEVQKHSLFGYEIIKQKQGIPSIVAEIAYEHHERLNGEGYPRKLSGSRIQPLSQITGIADVYDAVMSDRVYRKAYLPHEAYELIAAAGDFHYEYRYVEAFLSNIAVYPVGTVVALNSGEVGVVSKLRRGLSHRPVIQITQKTGETNETYELDLAKRTDLVITRIIQ